MQKSAKIGYLVGSLIAVIAVALLSLASQQQLLAKGPMNSGHEKLVCRDCHLPAPGTFRQQLQANVRHWLGRRAEPADFGYLPVNNEQCLNCHARPNDKHPVSRFLEPRFAQARQAIQPQNCNSCHLEHNHRRVTISNGYCVECHRELKVKNDPINVPHEKLIAEQNWNSCLTCHDFHGNHLRKAPKDIDQAIPLAKIADYFSGGSSPYSDQKQFYAKKGVQQ